MPSLKSLILFLPLFSFNSITQAQQLKRIDGSRLSVDSLHQKIEYLLKAANVSGVAVAIFNNNQPVFARTYGLANVQQQIPLQSNSVMYAASFAKMVFAYIAMHYVQEKLIHLDTPLVRYLSKPLPEYQINGFRRGYADLRNDERYKKITARMCLTHTTGFPNWRWFEADKKIKIKFEPGSRYSYSGEGLYLLQFVLEQLTGKDYETISKEKVFTPLDMTMTSQVWQSRFESTICYGHNDKGVSYELMKWKEPSAGGSMSTTFNDFIKFYTAFINGKGLTKRSFQEMTTGQIRIRSRSQFGPRAAIDSNDNDIIQLGYGLGVGTFTTPYGRAFFKEGHDEGWGHYSICFPDKKTAIVIMTNNDNGEHIFKELLTYAIGDTFTPWRWQNYIPYNYTPPAVVNIYKVTAAELDQYAGIYSSKELPIKITISRNDVILKAQAAAQPPLLLQAVKKHIFSQDDEGIVITFYPATSSFELKQGAQTFIFVKE